MANARDGQNDVLWTDFLIESIKNVKKTSGLPTYLFGISHRRCDICKETFPDNSNKCSKCQEVDNRLRSCHLCQSQKVTYWCYDCNSYVCNGCEKSSNSHDLHKIFATEGSHGLAFQRSTWSLGLQSMIRNQIRSKKRKRNAVEEVDKNKNQNGTSKQAKATTVSVEKPQKEIHRPESSIRTAQPLASASKESTNSHQRRELDAQSNNPTEVVDQTTATPSNQIPVTSAAIPVHPPPLTASNSVIDERPMTPTEDIAQVKEEVVSRRQTSAIGPANGGRDNARATDSTDTSQRIENRSTPTANTSFSVKQEQIWQSDQNHTTLPIGAPPTVSSILNAGPIASGESSVPPVATPMQSPTGLPQTVLPTTTTPLVAPSPAGTSASAPVQTQPQPISQPQESTGTSSMSFNISLSLADPLKVAVIEEYNKINNEVIVLENRLHEATLAVKNFSLNNVAMAARLNERMNAYRGLLTSKLEERHGAVAKVIVYASNVRAAARKIDIQNLGDIPHVLTSCHKRCAQLTKSIRQHQETLSKYHQGIEKVISEGNANQFHLLQALGNKIKEEEQAIQAADQERDHQFTIMAQYSQRVRQAVERHVHQATKK